MSRKDIGVVELQPKAELIDLLKQIDKLKPRSVVEREELGGRMVPVLLQSGAVRWLPIK